MKIFENYARYYNAFYRDKDYKKESKDIDNLLKKYGDSVKTIINFGCGTGNHDFELAQLGYSVEGVDLSSSMIEIAKNRAQLIGINEKFYCSDVREFCPDKKYDAVISLFHVMSYQNSNEDVRRAFLATRKCLDVGGVFLFDVWYGPGVLTDLPVVRSKEVEDEQFHMVRIAEPIMHDKDNIVDVSYKIYVIDKRTYETQTINEVHHMRYFFKPELELLLNECGYKLIDNIDCDSLKETSFSSWTSYFICQAI